MLSFFLLTPASAQEMQGGRLVVSSAQGASQELPLIKEQLRITIDQGHAATEFAHTFQNESSLSLEGNYNINLAGLATATGFAYQNGKDKIVGEIFEKEAARQIYETVVGTGRDPGLLEQAGEGAFSFRVAPIVAGEKKTVWVSTASQLLQKGRMLEFQAPLGDKSQGSSAVIHDTRAIKKVWSPTHNLRSEKISDGFRVEILKASDPKNKQRLILRYEVEEKDFELVTALHQDKGQDAYLSVAISAPESFRPQKEDRDITLVIDRSGSMMGAPLSAAIAASQGVVRKLRDDDRLNLVLFDDGVESLFEQPQTVSQIREQALQYLGQVETGGGTDLALALEETLKHQTPGNNRAKIVLFVTDGQSSAAQALEAAKKAPSSMRLYTVGMGQGVDRPLLSRMAGEGRGIFTYVADEANLERDVDRLFSRIGAPVVSDIKLSVQGAQLTRMYPRRSPDLFEQDRLQYSMRLKTNASPAKQAITIKLSGVVEGKTRSFSKTIPNTTSSHPWVARTWAEKRIDDLREQMSAAGETPELKTESIELALAYSLVTPYTSFLAIPESEVSDQVRGSLEEERQRRAQILAKHQDAASLSRSIMPPGDPVITVRAPRSALGVTALFPFGMSLDLQYDQQREVWEGRFLVPHQVKDGDYEVQILVAHADGQITQSSTHYEIDSQTPAFEVLQTDEGDAIRLVVSGDEALREVRILDLEGESAGKNLSHQKGKCVASGCQFEKKSATEFEALIQLQPGSTRVRIVVTDLARNESSRELTLYLPESEGGC